jgi:hypothetical protein
MELPWIQPPHHKVDLPSTFLVELTQAERTFGAPENGVPGYVPPCPSPSSLTNQVDLGSVLGIPVMYTLAGSLVSA